MENKLFTDKQLEYIRNANHRWNLKSGATRSGKTFLDLRYIIPMRIRERAGKDGLSVILGVTKSTIERNILEPMRNMYGTKLVGEINSANICYLFGEKVYCLGAEKVSQVSKIRGSSIKYCYGDEVADWNEEVFGLLKSRLDKPYSCFDGACNPQHPKHWLKQFMEGDADIYLQEYTIFDNTFLPDEFIENLCKEYKEQGSVYYQRYILGRWVRAEGAIYNKFINNHDTHIINPKEWLKENDEHISLIIFGVDFGGTKSATSFVATGFTRTGTVIALEEEYLPAGKSVSPDSLNKAYSNFIKFASEKWGGGETRADSAEQILIRGLWETAKRDRLQTDIKDALKMKVNDRINLEQYLFSQRRLFVSEDCPHLIDALDTAVWDEKYETEDVRLDDGSSNIDSLDAFEYTLEPLYKDLMEV